MRTAARPATAPLGWGNTNGRVQREQGSMSCRIIRSGLFFFSPPPPPPPPQKKKKKKKKKKKIPLHEALGHLWPGIIHATSA